MKKLLVPFNQFRNHYRSCSLEAQIMQPILDPIEILITFFEENANMRTTSNHFRCPENR